MTKAILHLDQFQRINGETDDRGRFQRAIDATPEGGELWVPPGHYRADSLKIRKSMRLSFSRQAKIEAVEINKDILTIEGERECQGYALLTPVKRGDRKLLFSEAPTDWKAGDMIVLTDETVRFSDRQKEVNTEVHEIAYIEGNTVILRDFVRLPKAISTNNVYRVFPLEDVEVNQLTYQMKEGSTRGIGIFMQYVRHAVIHGIQGYRGAGSGVQIRKALHTRVQRFRFLFPQVTGSGQGYGVQFFGGCLHVIVKDGYTVGCRHAVDLDGCFDAYVSHVTDYHSSGAAFVMSHNGFTSDIVFDQCQTYYTYGSGFVANSQGFADPLMCTFYHFTIKNCKVVMNHSAHAGVLFTSPCVHSSVQNCKIRYRTDKGVGLNNAGIRLYPVRTQIKISDCQIQGVNKGIAIQVVGFTRELTGPCRIIVRDTVIEMCDTVFFCSRGTHARLRLYNIECRQIRSSIFYFHRNSCFYEFVLQGLSLFDSPQCRFVIGAFQGKQSQGMIKQIVTDNPRRCSLGSRWTLSYDHLLFDGDGETILLTGSPTTSGQHPLPNGWVEGQRITLMTIDGEWILHKGKNMVFKDENQPFIRLTKNRRTTSFVWKNGYWFQTD